MKKLLLFFICGVIQFAIDSSLYTVLSYVGVGVTLSNVSSRALAASVGYYINGRLTFKRSMNGRVLFKFVIYWAGMTVISTVLLYLCKVIFNSQNSVFLTAVSKVCVEIVLFFISFIIAKLWVYKHD
ncbi:GtrA family protein [Buttiauxella sp. WJP83]|uniref:GtrA family protein n=1 Tax=Buttiauxella sp. WJP83 TaxID=2986951 RepID=UPI0022DD8048|nr:GtrA family protein [Buttiauxella sp. WJP83]WBM72088.1 GtrA family protein [Buttiauxella sp. WJP83]